MGAISWCGRVFFLGFVFVSANCFSKEIKFYCFRVEVPDGVFVKLVEKNIDFYVVHVDNKTGELVNVYLGGAPDLMLPEGLPRDKFFGKRKKVFFFRDRGGRRFRKEVVLKNLSLDGVELNESNIGWPMYAHAWNVGVSSENVNLAGKIIESIEFDEKSCVVPSVGNR